MPWVEEVINIMVGHCEWMEAGIEEQEPFQSSHKEIFLLSIVKIFD